MAVEYTPEVLAELDARVTRSLPRWSLSAGAAVRLLNISENATFLVSDPKSRRELVLRVHRVGYSSAAEIRSELAWICALRAAGVIETAAPVAGVDGDAVQILESPAGAPARFAVAFERVPGREPEARDALHWFERLGACTARMHRHSRSWARPDGFSRKRWDFEAMVGANGFWGPWRAAIGLDAPGVALLERVLEALRLRLEAIGQTADVFGLVHADLRLANLLVDDARLSIIDFDDCGFSWYLYDFATAVSFIEHEPQVPDLLAAWVSGYREVLPLDANSLAAIPAFVVLRRILLTAWLASHAEVPLAREIGASFTAGTVALADAWMRGEYLRR
jgi:Ser/Thr protein kinase RdoA (MazF antagonist)